MFINSMSTQRTLFGISISNEHEHENSIPTKVVFFGGCPSIVLTPPDSPNGVSRVLLASDENHWVRMNQTPAPNLMTNMSTRTIQLSGNAIIIKSAKYEDPLKDGYISNEARKLPAVIQASKMISAREKVLEPNTNEGCKGGFCFTLQMEEE